MQNYYGNKEPFVFVYNNVFTKFTDSIIKELSSKKKVYVSSSFTAKDKRVLDKASALVVILSAVNVSDAEPLITYAVSKDKNNIPIYMDEVVLPEGLDMLLSTKQALIKSEFASDDDLVSALLSSPVLAKLSVTKAQKKAAVRPFVFGVIAALLIVAAAVFWIVRNNTRSNMIDPDSDLAKMGLSGDYLKITEVYIYGNALKEGPEENGAIEAPVSLDERGIYLPSGDEVVPRGFINKADDLANLKNVKELAVSGNSLEDVSLLFTLTKLKRLELSCNLNPLDLTGIGSLSDLEYLDLGYTKISGGLDEVAGLPNLKTLIISNEYLSELTGLDRTRVAVFCPQVIVSSFEELKEASEDGHVYEINLSGKTFTIPQNETVTIRKNVSFSSTQVETIENYGTVELYGVWGMGMVTKNNRGTVKIKDGGLYSCGMGETHNYGTFLVEKGGRHELERGEQFYQEDGDYINEGELFVGNGGRYYLNGGKVANTGLIRTEYTFDELDEQFKGELERMSGTGEVEAYEATDGDVIEEVSEEELDAYALLPNDPSDEASLDENGLTPRESAYFNTLEYYSPRMGGGQPVKVPVTAYTDPEMLLSKRPDHCTAYIARDMEIAHAPSWTEGYYELIVGPGVTATLKGDWTADSGITVMKGGTLIVDGTLYIQLGNNSGTFITRGKTTYDVGLDSWGNEWGIFANDGKMITEGSGSVDLYHIWSFANASEEGNINAEMRFDFTDTEPPFRFANGYHGFGSFKLCYRAPENNFEKKWWVEDIDLSDYEIYSNDITDTENLDKYGMTPRERAIYDFACSLDYLDHKNTSEKLNPIVNASELDLFGVRDGDIYIARDMEIDKASKFWYEKGGVWNIAVAPGATVTIKGDIENWTRKLNNNEDPNDIWITVMKGGTLVIDGELPFALLVNHGDLIVNGKLFSTYYDENTPDLVSMIANDGTITVNKGGSLDALQIWSFKGAKENGDITLHSTEYEKRYDYTDMKCPFAFEHGVHGFNSFFKYSLHPEDYEDGSNMLVQKFWN